jgi:hypothetical protein
LINIGAVGALVRVWQTECNNKNVNQKRAKSMNVINGEFTTL